MWDAGLTLQRIGKHLRMSMKCFLVPTERQRPTISISRKTLTFIASFPAGSVMKRGSTKEPVGKKNSGLGKLMSVLHQVKMIIIIIIIVHSVLSQSPFLKFLICQNQRF